VRVPQRPTARTVRIVATATAAVGVLALALAVNWPRSEDLLASPTGPSMPTASVSTLPGATMEVWAQLEIRRLVSSPVDVHTLARWSRGFLALGYNADYTRLSTLWSSPDGRQWTQLSPPYPDAARAAATPCGDGVLVLTGDDDGGISGWFSRDGLTWVPSPVDRVALPPLGLDRSVLSGGPTGALALSEAEPASLVRTTDCVSWGNLTVSADASDGIEAVAAFGGGSIALGQTRGRVAVGWWSGDGERWERIRLSAHEGDEFVYIRAGREGLVALSKTPGDPSTVTFWTSADGSDWLVSPNPLFREWGRYIGDGGRLVGYGSFTGPGEIKQWISSTDGVDWSPLLLTGDVGPVESGQARPFLVTDGILFSDFEGSLLGEAE